MEEYREWLEQQIERCLNDKDLQCEHWAFCKAYEKFTALSQPLVSGTFCEKCNPNGVVSGNVVRCKKCGRGLALIEQNYH